MKKLLSVAACLAVVGLTGVANAALIDFTSQDYASIDGEKSATYTIFGDTELTVATNKGELTFNQNQPAASFVIDGVTFEGSGDGLGVDYWDIFSGDDEVDGSEELTVAFNPDVEVNAIFFLDLYSGETYKTGPFWNKTTHYEDETALYKFNNGTWESVDGTTLAGTGLGSLSVSVTDQTEVSLITFKAAADCVSDFAIAGLDVTAPVPEPTTMLLFGTGIAGLAAVGRRKK